MARKRYAVGGNLSNRLNRRNYWFDENDGVVEFNSDTPTPSENTDNTDNTSESNSVVTIGTKSFASAFKQARTAGLDRFKWRGKTYTTEMSGENNRTTPKPSEAKASSNNNTNRIRRRNRNTNNSTQRSQQRTAFNNQNRQLTSTPNRNVNYTNNNNQQTSTNRRTTPTRRSAPVRSYQDYVNGNGNDYPVSYTRPLTLDIARAVAGRRGNSNNTTTMPRVSYTEPLLYDIARAVASKRRKAR